MEINEHLSHKAKVFNAVKGYQAGRKRGKTHKHPAVGINRQSSMILARVSAHSKRLGEDKGQDMRAGAKHRGRMQQHKQAALTVRKKTDNPSIILFTNSNGKCIL